MNDELSNAWSLTSGAEINFLPKEIANSSDKSLWPAGKISENFYYFTPPRYQN
jgi:hypothetical protein